MKTKKDKKESDRRRKEKERRLEKEKLKEKYYSKWPNGRMIYNLMKENKIKGDPRNYCVIANNSLIDYRASHNLVATSGGNVRSEQTYIIHKKDLYKIIGVDNALKFWHPTFGRIIDVKQKDKKK